MAAAPESAQAMLLARARARGRLPVIVGLAVPAAGGTEPGEAEIAKAQARLLADLGVADTGSGFAGPGIGNVKLYAAIPFLALTAEPEALARLLRHPLVVSAQEDTAAPPL